LAVALAKALIDTGTDAQVVNADASQVYADLAILSARPSDDEMDGVSHHLFGHIDGADAHNARAGPDEARGVIDHAHTTGKVPILVGGTGLYLRTLLFGIAPVPAIDPDVRDAVRALPVDEAYAALAIADPAAAARLNPADTTRVARALEVVRSTGRPLADWQQDREGGIAGDIALAPLVLPCRHATGCATAAIGGSSRCSKAARSTRQRSSRAISTRPACHARDRRAADRRLAWRQDQPRRRSRTGTGGDAPICKAPVHLVPHQPPPDWPRHHESLNIDSIDHFAIKLRDRLLTRQNHTPIARNLVAAHKRVRLRARRVKERSFVVTEMSGADMVVQALVDLGVEHGVRLSGRRGPSHL
jgi:tRNA dimethylallyltransferase